MNPMSFVVKLTMSATNRILFIVHRFCFVHVRMRLCMLFVSNMNAQRTRYFVSVIIYKETNDDILRIAHINRDL